LLLLGLFAKQVRDEAKSVPRHGIGDRAPPGNSSPTGGGCGGAVQGQGLGCGRDRVPSRSAVPARWRRRRITGGEIDPAITSNPANLRNIIMTWHQEFGCGARTDSSDRRSTAGRPGHTHDPRLMACPGATADFASDLWISAGADGSVYFSGTSGSASSYPPPVVVIASHSNGGGPPLAGTRDRRTARPRQRRGCDHRQSHSRRPRLPDLGQLGPPVQLPMTNFLISRTTDGGPAGRPPA
jgi:hypothetical protein